MCPLKMEGSCSGNQVISEGRMIDGITILVGLKEILGCAWKREEIRDTLFPVVNDSPQRAQKKISRSNLSTEMSRQVGGVELPECAKTIHSCPYMVRGCSVRGLVWNKIWSQKTMHLAFTETP